MSAAKRILLAISAVIATPVFAQDAPERTFPGPARYCGQTFAIDLEPGDHIDVTRGPDFLLEGLVSARGGFGLYEGFAPQDGTGDKRVDAGLGAPTYRIGERGGDVGYVVWTGTKAQRFYVHVWGQAFKGGEEDYPLLRRLQFGAAAKRGCPKPTLEQSDK